MVNRFSYEYFCGANVSVLFNGKLNNDVAGISYEVLDSTSPVYGYSSRLFDAVAPGQKLVRGSFVVNFRAYNSFVANLLSSKFNVDPKYEPLERMPSLDDGISGYREALDFFESDIAQKFLIIDPETKASTLDPNKSKQFVDYLSQIAYSGTYNKYDGLSMAETLHESFGLETEPFMKTNIKNKYSSLDATLMGPFNIKIDFMGGQDFEIVSCYVNNFGSTIQISEEVILQEFSFFGRNIIYKS